MARQLVLASSSTYRRALLQKILPQFEAAAPGVDESPHPGEAPVELVQRLALAKARALAGKFSDALIIGSDQVACLDGDILTKPGNFANARQQLQRCSGRRVEFATGLCLLDARSDEHDLLCEPFSVLFRELEDAEIDAYLRAETPYDCAGSFKAEGLGICLFESLQGKDPNTLVGLPLITLATLLRQRGVNPLFEQA